MILFSMIKSKMRHYLNTTSGSISVWAALSLPVLVGGGALSVDMSRVYNMDNELQSAADAVARAGAAELDQRPDSLSRSSRAMLSLVHNTQSFASDGKGKVEIETINFLKSLPENEYDTVESENITSEPSEAQYVEVTMKPERVNTLFPTDFVSFVTNVTLKAQSLAAFDQKICTTAPVFFCNPAEGLSESIYELMEDPNFLRRQIQFKSSGNGKSQYGPGNFGYLDPFGGNSGASVITDAMAIDKTNSCISKSSGVRLRPGNIASARQGFNTRFDIYEGSFKKKSTDPRYAPAANVTKGYVGKKTCSSSPSNTAFGLPNDNCFLTGTCSAAEGRMGNGNWDFIEYMRINHNYKRNITIEGIQYSINYTNQTMTPSTPPSRYSVYRWEIDNESIPGAQTYGRFAVSEEEGHPTCHASGPSKTVEDRRVIQAALLNCGAIEASGVSMAGRTDPLPVETFVKVFLTQPMGQGNESIIWGEIIGPVVQGEDDVSKDEIALVR